MAILKFKKPELKMRKVKAMIYGKMNTGKSTIACSFPNSLYIDPEDTLSKPKYAAMLIKNNSQGVNSSDFYDILDTVKSLKYCSTYNGIEVKNLIVDNAGMIYENLVNDCERKVGSDFGRHISMAKNKFKYFIEILLSLDLNIIITCQEKTEYGPNMTVVGSTYNGYDRLGYIFDLVFELQQHGKEFVSITRKTRLDEFPSNEKLNLSYSLFSERIGKDVLESVPKIITICTDNQVSELLKLIDVMKIPKETYEKWIEKANCENFEEMSHETMQKCIDHLKSKIKGEVAA